MPGPPVTTADKTKIFFISQVCQVLNLRQFNGGFITGLIIYDNDFKGVFSQVLPLLGVEDYSFAPNA